MSGRMMWGRFSRGKSAANKEQRPGPVKRTPICLLPRTQEALWRTMAETGTQEMKLSHHAKAILAHLEQHGASFFDDIVARTPLLRAEAETAIGELVAGGLATSDGYAGLRALLTPSQHRSSRHAGRRRHRKPVFGIEQAGRWTRMQPSQNGQEEQLAYETLEELASIYLRRWGVLFRSLLEKEAFAPPWRLLVRVLRRLELRGDVRGGRFVSKVSGEQFALPETVERLRKVRKQKKTGTLMAISAVDPLNLLGFIIPGRKIPNLTNNRILFEDGVPIAVLESKEVRYLKEIPPDRQGETEQALMQRTFPSVLRAYLGKSVR